MADNDNGSGGAQQCPICQAKFPPDLLADHVEVCIEMNANDDIAGPPPVPPEDEQVEEEDAVPDKGQDQQQAGPSNPDSEAGAGPRNPQSKREAKLAANNRKKKLAAKLRQNSESDIGTIQLTPPDSPQEPESAADKKELRSAAVKSSSAATLQTEMVNLRHDDEKKAPVVPEKKERKMSAQEYVTPGYEPGDEEDNSEDEDDVKIEVDFELPYYYSFIVPENDVTLISDLPDEKEHDFPLSEMESVVLLTTAVSHSRRYLGALFNYEDDHGKDCYMVKLFALPAHPMYKRATLIRAFALHDCAEDVESITIARDDSMLMVAGTSDLFAFSLAEHKQLYHVSLKKLDLVSASVHVDAAAGYALILDDDVAHVLDARDGKARTRYESSELPLQYQSEVDGRDRTVVATQSEDEPRVVSVFEVPSKQAIGNVKLHATESLLCLSADARYIATTANNEHGSKVIVYNHNGSVVHEFPTAHNAAFSPNSDKIALLCKGTQERQIRVHAVNSDDWDVGMRHIISLPHGYPWTDEDPLSFQISADGYSLWTTCSRIVNGEASGVLLVWSLVTGSLVYTSPLKSTQSLSNVFFMPGVGPEQGGLGSGSSSIGFFSDDLMHIVTPGASLMLRRMPFYRSNSEKATGMLASTPGAFFLPVSSDFSRLLHYGDESKSLLHLQELDVYHGLDEFKMLFMDTQPVISSFFSPDSSFVMTIKGDNSVTLWDPNTGQRIRTITEEESGTFLDLSPNSQFIVTSMEDEQTAVSLVSDGTVLATLEEVVDHQFSPNSELMAWVGEASETRVIITSLAARGKKPAGRTMSSFTCEGAAVEFVFSPQSSRLLVLDDKNKLSVVDPASGKATHSLQLKPPREDELIHPLIWHPSGDSIAYACGKTIIAVDLETGKVLYQLDQHQHKVDQLHISPDGRVLLSCSVKGELIFWNLVSERPQLVHRSFITEKGSARDDRKSVVQRVKFARDSSTVAISSLKACYIYLVPLFPRQPSHGEVLASVTTKSPGKVLDGNLVQPSLLQDYPAVVGNFDITGHTLIHECCVKRRPDTLRTVLSASYPPRTLSRNEHGDSALDLCLKLRSRECLQLLLQHMHKVHLPYRDVLTAVLPGLAQTFPGLMVQVLTDISFVESPANLQGSWDVPFPKANTVFRVGDSAIYRGNLWQDELAFVLPEDPLANAQLLPASSYTLGLPGITSNYDRKDANGKSRRHTNPLRAIVEKGLIDVLGTPIMRQAIEFKWEKFAKQRFMWQVGAYMLYLFFFTVASLTSICPSYTNGGQGGARLILETVLALFTLYYLTVEALQLMSEGVAYFRSWWNMLDVVGYSLAILWLFLHVGCFEGEEVVSSITAVVLWTKTLGYARGFAATGPFVRMIQAIVKDIFFFLVVLAAVVCGFSHAFFLIFRGTKSEFSRWMVLMKLYRMMLGDTPSTEDFQVSDHEWLAIVLYVAFTLVVSIVMLNLLIAVMANIYQHVVDNVDNEWLQERAQIILEIEESLPSGRKKSLDMFPEYVHILTASHIGKDILNIKHSRSAFASERDIETFFQRMDSSMKEQHQQLQSLLKERQQ